MRPRYLITGHHGSIGVEFCTMLSGDGVACSTFDEPNPCADICIHLAAKSDATVTEYIDSNLVYLGEIIEHCEAIGIKKLIFFSGAKVYGDKNQEDVCETDCHDSPNLYAISKLFGEEMLKQSNLQVLVLRLPGVLTQTGQHGVLTEIYKKLVNNIDVELTNADKIFNNFILAEDVYGFIKNFRFKEKFDIVNLAVEKKLTLGEIAQQMKVATGSSSNIIFDGSFRRFFNISIEKAKNKYGFSPICPVATIEKWCKKRVDLDEASCRHLSSDDSFWGSMGVSGQAASPTYFYNSGQYSFFSASLIKKIEAKCMELKNTVRICLHKDADSDMHNMIIAHYKDGYVRPHANPRKSKAYHIIKGEMQMIGIDKDQNEIFRTTLSRQVAPVVRIEKGVYLILRPITDVCVFQEITIGPFEREKDTVFAEWALETNKDLHDNSGN